MTLLAELVETSECVAGDSSRRAKIAHIAQFLRATAREEVEIAVSQNAYMRIEAGGGFDEIRALDGSGSELAMASSRRPRMRVRLLPDGRSPFLAVSSEIRTLVLYRDGVEVKRIPVDVFPGSLVDLGARVDCSR